MSQSQKNKAITEPEIGNSGVDSSKATTPGEALASPAELALALEASQQTIALLEQQLAKERQSNGSEDSIKQLADIIANAIVVKKEVEASPNVENINRTSDFKNTRVAVDGRSLMEAQQTLVMFKNEQKRPISVPKAMANVVGTSLAVTVNGVRVCVPCDGRTYMINETHYEHIRERLAKLDILAADTEPQVVEIN